MKGVIIFNCKSLKELEDSLRALSAKQDINSISSQPSLYTSDLEVKAYDLNNNVIGHWIIPEHIFQIDADVYNSLKRITDLLSNIIFGKVFKLNLSSDEEDHGGLQYL